MSIYGKPLLTGAKVDSASGPIVSVNDALAAPLRSLLVNIDPVQDLHGYDYPWPAGGGKNKLVPTYNTGTSNGVTCTRNSDGSYKITGTPSATATFYVDETLALTGEYILNGCPSGGSNSTYKLDCNIAYTYYTDYGDGVTFTANGTNMRTRIVIYQGAGSNLNLTFYPMIRLSTEADATYAPYSNICPISGWTGANVVRTGKNLFDKDTMLNLGGYIQTNGSVYVATGWQYTDYIPVNGKTFTVSNVGGIVPGIALYDANKQLLVSKNYGTTGANNLTNVTITANVNASYCRFSLNTTNNASIVQLEYGETATEYEPFGTTYPITWQSAGTVYGGTLDVTNGVLTVDRAMVDLGTLDWETYSSPANHVFRTTHPSGISVPPSNIATSAICDGYYAMAFTPISSSNNGAFAVSFNRVVFINQAESTFSGFAESVDGMKLVYPLETPITIPLTPTEITTLLGQNNIWADTGDLTIEYLKRSLTYIS